MSTEKITINMSHVDLGKVDLLVDEGFYSNRTDFIRTAIKLQLNQHNADTKSAASRKSIKVFGAYTLDSADLKKAIAANKQLEISVVGLLSLANDVTIELADQAIESISIWGSFKAPADVKKALANKIL